MSGERWCVKDRNDVWCAVKGSKKPPQDAGSVETICGDFIALPHGTSRREPTCDKCRSILGLSRPRGAQMSNFIQPTVHPVTGKTEDATWLDNGRDFTVVFSDGSEWPESKVKVPEREVRRE